MSVSYTHLVSDEHLAGLNLLADGMVHMARLAVYISRNTNGVARIHSEILKSSVLRDWYDIYPERFQNETNGITQRRWLALCNRELTGFFAEKLGSDRFITDLEDLRRLLPLADDPAVLRCV